MVWPGESFFKIPQACLIFKKERGYLREHVHKWFPPRMFSAEPLFPGSRHRKIDGFPIFPGSQDPISVGTHYCQVPGTLKLKVPQYFQVPETPKVVDFRIFPGFSEIKIDQFPIKTPMALNENRDFCPQMGGLWYFSVHSASP